MKKKRRRSRQRERIYELIKENPHHPTALWIYDELRKERNKLSLGNVYRNIKILVEEGRTQVRDFGDGIEHYDAIVSRHYHFICEECGRISDFPMTPRDEITMEARRESGYAITGHTIQFFGLCDACGEKAQK